MIEVDKNYQLVLKQWKETIKGSRHKVIQVANSELLTTYREIGRTILEQKEKAGWGKKIIGKLANDLKAKFPNMRGLSERNLVYMQTFASVWPFFPFMQRTEALPFTQSPIAQLRSNENQHSRNQQTLLLQIPWTHHIIILDKAKTLDERIFYIKEVIRNGWSINTLKLNIETNLYIRQGNAITGLNEAL